MAVERITLRWFQIHDHFTVDLDPLCTTFVGETDAGKTAILRALQWAFVNRPQGSGFVGRHGQRPHATVNVQIDGRTVGRRKGASVNLYRIDDQLFRSFGTNVPQPIADLLNVGDINFQDQLSPPFWLTLPPAEVARQLNGVINLGLIDRALTNAAKLVRRTGMAVQVSQERLDDARTRRDGLRWAQDLSDDVAAVRGLSDRLSAARQRADSLRQAASDAVVRGRAVRSLSDAAQHGLSVLALGRQLLSTTERRDRFSALVGNLRRCAQSLAQPALDTTRLDRAWAAYQGARLKQRTLNALVLGMAQLEHEVQFADTQIGGLNDRIKKLTGDKCPVCKRPWPNPSRS